MCGLVGAAGPLGLKHEKAFKQLLFMDTLRGAHSTGICHLDLAGVAQIHKKAMPATDYLDLTTTGKIFSKVNSLLIGHNRYATMGAHTAENAHPFHHGKIYGAHNGTLRLQSLLPDNHRFKVDSDNIFYAIDKDGLQATIPKLAGAYALTYWNSEDETINIVRNDERELYFTMTTDGCLFWASEKFMLLAALRRNDIGYGRVVQVAIDKHYKFKMPKVTPHASTVVSKPVVQDVTPYVPPVYNTYRYPAVSHTPAEEIERNKIAACKKHGINIDNISDISFWFEGDMPEDDSFHIDGVSLDGKYRVRVFGIRGLTATAVNTLVNHDGYVTLRSMYGSQVASKYAGDLPLITCNLSDIVPMPWDTLGSNPFIGDEDTDDIVETVLDHRGVAITEQAFNLRYHACSWCSTTLDFRLDNHLSSYNDGICPDCVDLPDVKMFI